MATTAKTTKTKPAKKPANKPAGASVKPKQTKTVKSSPKTTKPTSTKPAATSQSSAKTTKGKTNNRKCEIFFGIIMIVAAIAIIGGAICYAIFGSNNNVIMVESGKGNQVATIMTQLPDTNINVLIPKEFKALSGNELKEITDAIDTSGADVKAVYTDKDQTAMIYLTELDQSTDNDKVKESIDEIAKVLKTAGVTNVQTSLKDVQGHNIGILKFSGASSADFPHQHTAFFSDNGKTYNLAFFCEQDLVDEWDKVGDSIIDSISFQE